MQEGKKESKAIQKKEVIEFALNVQRKFRIAPIAAFLHVSCTVSICVFCDAFSIPTEKIESNRKALP